MEHLQTALAIVRNFKPMAEPEMRAISARLKSVAGDGRYEYFKTTQRFDSGHHRLQHGFPA